jgi:taurine--2-oxoglutarate transaminase|uniref:Aminotransferase n=1 Tax=viral metagenome TaxID=1070528 RepID=A0A6C0LTD8_9ZZZZ
MRQLINSRLKTWSQKSFDKLPNIISSRGCWLMDSKGKKYFDLTSQAISCNLGHTVPHSVKKAVLNQLNTVPYVYGGLARTPIVDDLIHELGQVTPPHLTGFLFPSSGSEANEAAIRIANMATGRKNVLSVKGSYHGGTTLTLAVSDDCRRVSVDGCINDNIIARNTSDVISNINSSLSCLIIEPVIGSGGVYSYSQEWWDEVTDMCKKNGVIVICDEVMVGFGRTGSWWAHERYTNFKPDIMTMAKGMTSSWAPLSAVVISDDLKKHFETTSIGYGSTWSAHPLSVAVAVANIRELRNNNVIEHVKKTEKLFGNHVKAIASQSSLFNNNIRHPGGFFACIDFATNDQDIVNHFKISLLEHGIMNMMRPGLFHIAPPLNTTEEELNECFKRVSNAVVSTSIKYGL